MLLCQHWPRTPLPLSCSPGGPWNQNLCDDATAADPFLLRGARALVIGAVAGLSHLVLFGLNRTKVLRDERHARLVELVRDR